MGETSSLLRRTTFTAIALVGAILSIITLVVSDWIEAAFNADPDQHSGTLEWPIAAPLRAAAVVEGALARRESRSPLTAAPVISRPR